jgi:hypothetical protein
MRRGNEIGAQREHEAVTTENAEKKTKSASGENRDGCIVTDWFHVE